MRARRKEPSSTTPQKMTGGGGSCAGIVTSNSQTSENSTVRCMDGCLERTWIQGEGGGVVLVTMK